MTGTRSDAGDAFSIGDLKIGVATSALQIEGGDRNNNWYDWAQLSGRIQDGSSPVRATDHWNRWREDTALMADLGLQCYRMGVEWARIEPSPGEYDEAVLDRYREELTAVRDAGIVPLVTLHHFTNPSWVQERGEFAEAATVELYLAFVEKVVTALGDLVTDWVTINEPNVYVVEGLLFGEGPAGDTRTGAKWPTVRRTLRHLAQAHCRGYDLIHRLQPHAKVGFAHHMRVFAPRNPRNPAHRALTKVNEHLFQDVVAEAMLRGRFATVLGDSGGVQEGRYYDFLGLNYYSRTAVTGLSDGTFPGVAVNDMGWEIFPEGIVQCARALHEKYDAPVWITENGTPDADDRFRARFLYDHLRALVESGVPVERFHHWCFVDNWEWSFGEVPRFGLVHNDYDTQTRTPRASARFVADVIAHRGVTQQAYDTYVAGQEYPRSPA